MPLAIVIVLVLSVASVLGATRMRVKTGSSSQQLPGTSLTVADLETLSHGELEVLLDRLEQDKEPEPVMGAMCYGAMLYPEFAEYVCPVCGEKTIYPGINYDEYEMSRCRRLFGEIETILEMDMELDESLYCQSCTQAPDDSPRLVLLITQDDGTVVSNPVTLHDLRLLESFVNGRLFYYTWNDGQEPLKPYAERLRTLLGIDDAAI